MINNGVLRISILNMYFVIFDITVYIHLFTYNKLHSMLKNFTVKIQKNCTYIISTFLFIKKIFVNELIVTSFAGMTQLMLQIICS